MGYSYMLFLLGAGHLSNALASLEPFQDLYSRNSRLSDRAVYARDLPELYLTKRGRPGKQVPSKQVRAPAASERTSAPPLFKPNIAPVRVNTPPPPPPSLGFLGPLPARPSTPPAPALDVPSRSGASTPGSGAGSPGPSRAESPASSIASTDSPPRRRSRPSPPEPRTPGNQGIPFKIPDAPKRRPMAPWQPDGQQM